MKKTERAKRNAHAEEVKYTGQQRLREMGRKALRGKVEDQCRPCQGQNPPEQGERMREVTLHTKLNETQPLDGVAFGQLWAGF